MNGFITFIREQGVVGLAIGFILGGAVSKLVTSLVEDLIQPTIGLMFGSSEGLTQLSLGPIMYGNLLVNIIDFLIIAAVIYFLFKGVKLDKLDKKKS